jgi:Type II secretion system (T2SS), protein G
MCRQQQTRRTRRRALTLLLSIAFICAPVRAADKVKTINKDAARKTITRVAGLELKKSAVRVKAITGTSAAAEVAATVKTAFRFSQDEKGQWQVLEVRVGDRQWEEIDLLARTWHFERTTPLVAQLEALTAQLSARMRARAEEQKRRKVEAEKAGAQDQDKKKQKKEHAKSAPVPDEDLGGGPIVVKTFAALLSSATVEAELDMTFRLSKDARGQWQVTEARIGDGAWADVTALVRALDAEKRARARTDLDALAAALEAYRRERGFYVVADTSAVLVDQLNPRYTAAIIRIDPWHRPYEYAGTPTGFVLRSVGPDGKANTADDLVVNNTTR